MLFLGSASACSGGSSGGDRFTHATSGVSVDLRAATFVAGHAWFVGDQGTVLRDDAGLAIVADGTTSALRGIADSSGSPQSIEELWVVGAVDASYNAMHWANGDWNRTVTLTSSLSAVWGVSPVWMGTSDGHFMAVETSGT